MSLLPGPEEEKLFESSPASAAYDEYEKRKEAGQRGKIGQEGGGEGAP